MAGNDEDISGRAVDGHEVSMVWIYAGGGYWKDEQEAGSTAGWRQDFLDCTPVKRTG